MAFEGSVRFLCIVIGRADEVSKIKDGPTPRRISNITKQNLCISRQKTPEPQA
jgi:hypothetical protein